MISVLSTTVTGLYFKTGKGKGNMGQDNHLKARSGETCFLSFFTNQSCNGSTDVAEDSLKRGKLTGSVAKKLGRDLWRMGLPFLPSSGDPSKQTNNV
jgi:hypothetical protein